MLSNGMYEGVDVSQRDEIVELFTPEAVLSEDFGELSYSYATDFFETIEINILFYEDDLYYTEFVAIPNEITDEMLVLLEGLEYLLEDGFPEIDLLFKAQPHFFGIANMVKDGLLATGLSFASGLCMEESANLEFSMYLDDLLVESVYYRLVRSEEESSYDMANIKNDLFYYTYSNFRISPVLSELVGFNHSVNQWFKYDGQRVAEIIDYDYNMTFQDSGVEGDSIDTIASTLIDAGEDAVRESVGEGLERLTYSFEAEEGDDKAVVSLIFVEGAFTTLVNVDNSVALVDGNWRDYLRTPLKAEDIPFADSLTPLATNIFDVFAVGTVELEEGYHHAFLAPVETEDGDISLAFIDVRDYYVENITYLDDDIDFESVDYMLFEHLTSQYDY
ncbi:hypothetical protein ACTQ54_07005 [Fundicoccus sp. Sow4_H7]|uniref:hypothetical protein n=1 Tax=Fundicoccus sp. Sow4_H7 TaxID=3438784 RepID=UPI003F9397B2